MLTGKQQEFLRSCSHRWNVKIGATGSGKSFVDYAVVIPKRILACRGEGLIVLMGNTLGTLERNILQPMRDIWGSCVGAIRRSDNTVQLFGRRCYALGADNAKHVSRIQGATMEYVYGDEITTWERGVFEMLKSRLRTGHSMFDGTCNPDSPSHWFKNFLDSDADIYQQHYVIDDGCLPADVVEQLKREYSGTVYYDRFILGKWVAAEGAIYRVFADRPEPFFGVPADGEIRMVWIGIDFGGNGSAHAACVVGTDARLSKLWVLDEYYRKEVISPTQLERDLVGFVQSVKDRWRIAGIYADSAEQVLIRGLNAAFAAARLPEVGNSRKKPINDRIRFTTRMMGAQRFIVNPDCRHTVEALRTARWDPRHPTEDKRLDDGTVNVDSLDAMEYAFERQMGDFIR